MSAEPGDIVSFLQGTAPHLATALTRERIDLLGEIARLRTARLYAVIDGDGECVGIYSTMTLASQAMERVSCCCVEERQLDKLPDWPEPGEPDYGAPSAAERLARDSFDADRGGVR